MKSCSLYSRENERHGNITTDQRKEIVTWVLYTYLPLRVSFSSFVYLIIFCRQNDRCYASSFLHRFFFKAPRTPPSEKKKKEVFLRYKMKEEQKKKNRFEQTMAWCLLLGIPWRITPVCLRLTGCHWVGKYTNTIMKPTDSPQSKTNPKPKKD